jgi:hypothetical protein
MLGTEMVLIALGSWIAIAPIVAIVVGRALKAADPYADVEYIRSAPQPVVVARGSLIARPAAIAR